MIEKITRNYMERQSELCYAVIRARQLVTFRVTGKSPGPGPQSWSRMKMGLTRSSLPIGTASGSSKLTVDSLRDGDYS